MLQCGPGVAARLQSCGGFRRKLVLDNRRIVELTAEIVSTYLSNNSAEVGQVGDLVQQVHGALSSLGVPEEEPKAKVPVVSVRASIKPDRLICMECGRESKMLRRHLQTAHGMTPDDYRKDYGLPDTYPMVAAEYAQRRRTLAKEIGLGRKKGEKPAPKGKGRGGKAKSGTGDRAAEA
jgi:predicted transcriptional regulator